MNSKKIEVYQCSICNKIFFDKEFTDKCCKPGKCNICGIELKPCHLQCDKCSVKIKYEKANKIKYSDYKLEYLYDDRYDKYFKNYEDLLEFYELNDDNDIPKWAWGCSEYQFKIDIDSALEDAEEKMYEDFDDIVGVEELYEFIEKWNDKQTAKAYFIDNKTVVLLSGEQEG
jgi:hypothetical protein